MLDEFNPNDANSLNSAFYEELLYILGLCEVKESSKLLIKPSSQSANTLYNAILAKLSQDKQDFERVMSFVVLWLNRILFLKLIEANLVRFNDDESLKFLNPNKVRNFKALSQLFFEILAKKPKDRANSTLDYLPYLNSALFQKQAIEREILDISALDDSATLPYFAKTQIKDKNAKKKAGSVPLLVYIFEFLDAFDFGSDEKSPELALQKELISSSVLGLVFEKLNGYKEGSFYTPSFITSYMCRASLEKVILSKFNDKFKWQCEDLKALRERIDRDFSTKAQEFKAVLNSIRICDPAVGSGHFLVSALNEMIAIYHALGLAQRLNPCELALLSDELVITKPNGEIYAYKKPKIKNDESHAIQKALFTLKKQIIENNLFGVDINENSCEITKLRLWIELLKNSYYLQKDDDGFDENLNDEIHQMQTLPNIDINIKCGNSLISYFELNRSLTHYPNIKERMQKYKSVIKDYKEGFFDDKMCIEKEIKALKESFRTFCFKDKFNKEIKAFTAKCEAYSKKYGNFLAKDDENLSLYIAQSFSFFDFDENKARLEFSALKKEYESIFNLESNKPFEWRFEFPEVLNENGEFMGFDLVVGNPPYIKEMDNKKLFENTKNLRTYQGKMDIWYHFVGKGFDLLKNQGILTFIATNNWTTNAGAKNLRNVILKESQILNLVDFGSYMVFDSASIQTMIMEFKKINSIPKSYTINYFKIETKNPTNKHRETILTRQSCEGNLYLTPTITPSKNIDKPLTFVNSQQDEVLNKILCKGKFQFKADEITNGIHPHYDFINKRINAEHNNKFINGEGIFGLSALEKENLNLNQIENHLIKPYFDTHNFARYYANPKNTLWLIYTDSKFKNPNSMDKYPNIKKHLDKFKNVITSDNKPYGLHRARDEKFFIGQPRIIALRKCVNRPLFSYVDFDCYVSATFYIIKTDRLNSKYLIGILNSQLVAFWLKHKGKMQGNNYQIDKEPLLNIPIVEQNSTNQSLVDEIINLVDKILALKAENSSADTNKLEKDIDDLVFKLYDLNETEIKLIKA